MKNNPEYFYQATLYIPTGSSPGMNIPQYLNCFSCCKMCVSHSS